MYQVSIIQSCKCMYCMYMIVHYSSTPCRLEGEGQKDLADCAVSIDPEYNILWSYSADTNKVSCFNPIAANVEGVSSCT